MDEFIEEEWEFLNMVRGVIGFVINFVWVGVVLIVLGVFLLF